ncbi:MAG: DUF853 family protein [Deltaproteobacteria bacterium]|nr:MAG: DUF853 family protein [Deltaproteobacteria bacterium]
MQELHLGKSQGKPVTLPASTLLRHAVCLGSSGSGKTVACKVMVEEWLAQGLPVIAVDPQGDIASLANMGDAEEVEQRGTSLEKYKAYEDKAEVVVWTPASAVGVPLSVNPLAMTTSSQDTSEEERVRDRSFAAEALTDLLGYDLPSDKGRSVTALFGLLLGHASDEGLEIGGIAPLLQLLTAMPKSLADRIASIVDETVVDQVIRRLRMVSMGPQGLMLTGGVPLNIDTLLGRNDPELQKSGKARLSVIYLNSLGSERDKQFFLAQLAQALYRWMLDNPSSAPQVLFYVDEVAPYIPPVRKPVCKDALKLLLRQARKYGVCCLLATQSPGDLDYTALSQIGTWNLGRLMTRQELKKVESVLESIVPTEAEEVALSLPSLKPGQFRLICPDQFDAPVELQVRWLVTRHETLDEDGIADATQPAVRDRLEKAFGSDVEPGVVVEETEEERVGPVRGRAEVAVLSITGSGEGTVNPCEIVVQRGGSGKITALGGQTREAKESIKVAWEAAKGLQTDLLLPSQFARRYDVTVLDTRLAIKKDGPSAGLAYMAGIVAALTEQDPRPDVALTGEITILGKVLPVGGIEQKVQAAYIAGYATVVVPSENKGDVITLPKVLKENMEVITVSSVSEALEVVFSAPKRENLEPPHEIQGVEGPTDDWTEESEEAPPKELTTNEQVLHMLQREPTVLDYDMITDALGISRKAAQDALKELTDGGQAKRSKQGRRAVFFAAEHALLPEYDLLEPVEAVRLSFFEPEVRKRATSDLARSMFVFEKEAVESVELAYRPLYQVHFSTTVKEGWLFKRSVEKEDKLYFDGLTAELLSFVKGTGFLFEAETPSNPVDVIDLDNLACLETRMPGELPLLSREMDKLLGEKAAITAAQRKFSLEVLDTALVFLPIWRIRIAEKDGTSKRTLLLDGWEGKPIQLPRRKRS